MSRLALHLLGAPGVTQDDKPVNGFRSVKARALFYYVAANGCPEARTKLAGLFWGDLPDANANANLRKTLTNLRHLVGPYLTITRESVCLNEANLPWLDTKEFETALQSDDPVRWETAVALYRGDFLEGFYVEGASEFETWLLAERYRLREKLLLALHNLAKHYADRRQYTRAIGYARQLLTLDPLRESIHRLLMTLFAESGQRARALAQYEACTQILADELDTEPVPETTDLFNQIQAGDLGTATPALHGVPRHNLPASTTSFVGREVELERIKSWLARVNGRLLTLVGPGGVGKTRLALQAAAELLEEYNHGVWFVDLSGIRRPELVLATIAGTLGIGEVVGEPRLKTLKRALRQKQTLLLLDNFEQVIGAAPDVGELLADAPGLNLMVTSREVLRLYGERVHPVPSLAVPEIEQHQSAHVLSQNEAVRLFLARARAANPAFAITEDNAPAVAEICVRLEGLPLAIELAAARTRLFTPQQLLAQLRNRLQTLVGGARNLPRRQQTIRNTIDWSYQLLDDTEQLLFARLGAFVGGWTLEAAETVCATDLRVDVLDGLESLLDKSLICQSQQAAGGPRFTMLGTIRDFAVEKLVERKQQSSIYRRHTAYFLDWIRRPREYWQQVRGIQALEVDNVRAIMRRGLASREFAAPVEIVCRMYRFWEGYGYVAEIGDWLEKVLDKDGIEDNLPSLLYARALRVTGNLQGLLALDIRKGYRYYRRSLAVARAQQDHSLAAKVMTNMAILDSRTGNYAQARTRNEEALALFQEHGSPGDVRLVQANLAEQLSEEGAFEAAWAYAEKALNLAEELQSEGQVAVVMGTMGTIAIRQDKCEAARVYLERALAIWDEQQNDYWRSQIWGLLGALALKENKLGVAERMLMKALRACAEQHVRDRVPTILDWVAELRLAQGNALEAVRTYAAVDAFYRRHGLGRPPVEAQAYEQRLALAQEQLGDAVFKAAWEEGESLEWFELTRELAGD